MTARRALWMRFAVVAIAMTWAVVAVAAHCWLSQPSRHAAHPDHPLAAAVGAAFVVNTDHAHLSDNSTPLCPPDFAAVPESRSDSPVFALDVASSAPVLIAAHANLVVLAGRGPPGAWGLPRSGQDLLTRYCLTRR